MGSGDQILLPTTTTIDSNNNDQSKIGDPVQLLPPFSSSAQHTIFVESQNEQVHFSVSPPPDEPFLPESNPVSDETQIQNFENDNLLGPETFERLRSRSEGSMLRKPKKGCLLKKSNSTGANHHKLPRHVSFADASGFELTQIHIFDNKPPRSMAEFCLDSDDDDDGGRFFVKTATNNDIIGSTPLLRNKSVLAPSWCSSSFSAPSRSNSSSTIDRRFVPYFTLPWTGAGKHKLIYPALENRKICLESISISSPWRMTGTILIKNLSYHKRVFIRRTLDKWQSYKDLDARYVCAVDSETDRFAFDLRFAFKMAAGTRLEMALGYEDRGHNNEYRGQYWDNNDGINYSFWYNEKI